MKRFFAIAAVLAVWAFCAVLPSEAAIPKTGDIAVVVVGENQGHVKAAEAIMIQQLVAKGYRVVDERRMQQIRKDQAAGRAARLALEGNVEAIMKISSKYSASAVVAVRVDAGETRENRLKAYTGTATASVMVTGSGGARLYSDTVSGKQIGYTQTEAAQKSVEAAVRAAADSMTQ
jgi:hypothetical protein